MLDKTDAIRAGFGPRAAAFLIDRLLLVLAICLVRFPLWLSGVSGGMNATCILFRFSMMDVLCYLLMSVYFILLTYFTGSTLGKKVMGLRVEKEDGAKPSLADVIYRETIGRYLSGVLYLGYLMVLADSRHRAFHDYICDTRVVYDGKIMRPRPQTTPERNADYTVPGETPVADEDAPAPISEEPDAAEPFYTVPSALPAAGTPTEE